ncbi:Immune-associated nucleotide-binding protein 9 [Linum perenne]
MGECSMVNGSPPACSRTIVLCGPSGNGKSATGNTILGDKCFMSMISSSVVTTFCHFQATVLEDGQLLNVIDTLPGLGLLFGSDFFGKEIVNMVRNGIHAVILVLSVSNRFREEEEAAFRGVQSLFGPKIIDYLIIAFTGGDQLEDTATLDDYLGPNCPRPLKEMLALCDNRMVLFDNHTQDEVKRVRQVAQLMTLVDRVLVQNDLEPYTESEDLYFIEMQQVRVFYVLFIEIS